MREFHTIANIPVFVNDLTAYASEAYFLYSKLIAHQETLTRDSETHVGYNARLSAIENMRKAFQWNLQTLYNIQRILTPYVDPKMLVDFKANPNDSMTTVLKDFKYLKRDWGWDSESEEQVSIIRNALSDAIAMTNGRETAVFLGGGLGRVAFDQALLFETTYVLDKSFSMAYHFNELKKNDIEFFEIDDRNIYSPDDLARKVRATMWNGPMPAHDVEARLNRLKYFIGDVRSLPFDDNSVDAFFSVYFTDVLALRIWLGESKRVIKPNGLFIHFGPLDYFFSSISQMYSASEIIDIFHLHGFDCLINEKISSSHLPNETMSNKMYANWLFVAKKRSVTPKTFRPTSNLTLTGAFEYRLTGRISSQGTQEFVEFNFPAGTLENADPLVLTVLSAIGEGTNLETLLKKLNPDSTKDQEEISDIMKVLEWLVDNGCIVAA